MSFRFATCVFKSARALHARATAFARSTGGYIKEDANQRESVEWFANKPLILLRAIENYTHLVHSRDTLGSSDLFIQASSASEIQTGLSHIFTEYLTNVRLTE
jgi:hypothetical protein